MSLSRVASFGIGLAMAIFGLYLLFGFAFDWTHLIISLVLIIIGVWILLGLPMTI